MRQQGKRKRKAKEGALVGLFSLNFAIYFLKSEKYIRCQGLKPNKLTRNHQISFSGSASILLASGSSH